ncbi:uncharacterized protein TNCV_4553471 [Trichonephila clavipes]|nr:uncharacterized protein TNCV_4553471 [Trichonephila clavipes]
MDACKFIVPVQHGVTQNICRAVSLLVCLVEEKWEAPDHPQIILTQNWGVTEPKRTVTCMVLKATVNDRRRKTGPCHDFKDLYLALPISWSSLQQQNFLTTRVNCW